MRPEIAAPPAAVSELRQSFSQSLNPPFPPAQQLTFFPSLPKCCMRSSAVVWVIPSGA